MGTTLPKRDTLNRFLFEEAGVRGALVELEDTWESILERHDYPEPVLRLLGEMTAAALLLNSGIKFDGSLILQVRGDGPVSLIVVETNPQMTVRATAKLRGDVPAGATFKDLINANGKGMFVITLDPGKKAPGRQTYQGIVPLEGDTMSDVIENYMKTSEQLDTKIVLAASASAAKGLMLQKLPAKTNVESGLSVKSEDEEAAWVHLSTIAGTLGEKELLETDPATIRKRLFWQEDMFVFESLYPAFFCSCTREKVASMLKMLGKPEVDEMLKENDPVSVACDFCNKAYTFDAIECEAIFGDAPPLPPLKH